MRKLTKAEKELVENLKSRKCSEEGCFYYAETGYVLCSGHLRGFSCKMDDRAVALLKKAGIR